MEHEIAKERRMEGTKERIDNVLTLAFHLLFLIQCGVYVHRTILF